MSTLDLAMPTCAVSTVALNLPTCPVSTPFTALVSSA